MDYDPLPPNASNASGERMQIDQPSYDPEKERPTADVKGKISNSTGDSQEKISNSAGNSQGQTSSSAGNSPGKTSNPAEETQAWSLESAQKLIADIKAVETRALGKIVSPGKAWQPSEEQLAEALKKHEQQAWNAIVDSPEELIELLCIPDGDKLTDADIQYHYSRTLAPIHTDRLARVKAEDTETWHDAKRYASHLATARDRAVGFNQRGQLRIPSRKDKLEPAFKLSDPDFWWKNNGARKHIYDLMKDKNDKDAYQGMVVRNKLRAGAATQQGQDPKFFQFPLQKLLPYFGAAQQCLAQPYQHDKAAQDVRVREIQNICEKTRELVNAYGLPLNFAWPSPDLNRPPGGLLKAEKNDGNWTSPVPCLDDPDLKQQEAPKARPEAPNAPPQAPNAPPQAPNAPPEAPNAPAQAPNVPPEAPNAPPLAPQAAPPAPQAAPPAPQAAPPAPQAAPPAPQAALPNLPPTSASARSGFGRWPGEPVPLRTLETSSHSGVTSEGYKYVAYSSRGKGYYLFYNRGQGGTYDLGYTTSSDSGIRDPAATFDDSVCDAGKCRRELEAACKKAKAENRPNPKITKFLAYVQITDTGSEMSLLDLGTSPKTFYLLEIEGYSSPVLVSHSLAQRLQGWSVEWHDMCFKSGAKYSLKSQKKLPTATTRQVEAKFGMSIVSMGEYLKALPASTAMVPYRDSSAGQVTHTDIAPHDSVKTMVQFKQDLGILTKNTDDAIRNLREDLKKDLKKDMDDAIEDVRKGMNDAVGDMQKDMKKEMGDLRMMMQKLLLK